MRWAADRREWHHVSAESQCVRVCVTAEERSLWADGVSYVEVNLCVVVGLHRPHHLKPGLKGDSCTKVKRLFLTLSPVHAGISLSFFTPFLPDSFPTCQSSFNKDPNQPVGSELTASTLSGTSCCHSLYNTWNHEGLKKFTCNLHHFHKHLQEETEHVQLLPLHPGPADPNTHTQFSNIIKVTE